MLTSTAICVPVCLSSCSCSSLAEPTRDWQNEIRLSRVHDKLIVVRSRTLLTTPCCTRACDRLSRVFFGNARADYFTSDRFFSSPLYSFNDAQPRYLSSGKKKKCDGFLAKLVRPKLIAGAVDIYKC